MAYQPAKIRTRGHLPHWETPGASYSITFRLADSLPQTVLDAYQRERTSIVQTAEQMGRPLSDDDHKRLAELFSERVEHYLDQGIGSCHLRHPEIAKIVFDSIAHFHSQRYQLHTWCVMPNHVHILMRPLPSFGLDDILHSWKSYTSKEANKILKRTGTFWMPEYFDHLIRHSDDFDRSHRYILNNPRKIGLLDWPWVATHVAP